MINIKRPDIFEKIMAKTDSYWTYWIDNVHSLHLLQLFLLGQAFFAPSFSLYFCSTPSSDPAQPSLIKACTSPE